MHLCIAIVSIFMFNYKKITYIQFLKRRKHYLWWKWKSKLLSCVRLFLVNDKWDSWMASPTQWTRRSLSKHQETVKDREAWPLQSMGLQSQTWHSNWTTASNWIHSIFLRIFLGSLSIIWVGFHISFKVSVHLFILCILLLPLLFKLLSLY